MGNKKVQPNYRRRTLRLPDLDHFKLAVLNSLGSPGSRRVYVFPREFERGLIRSFRDSLAMIAALRQ
jgi:hypothetical protein